MYAQASPSSEPVVPLPVQRVALHAVASGLTPLIPVPFLDEYALRRVRQQMVRALLRERALSATERTVTVLAGLHPREGSRLQQLVSKTALFSLRLTWRKAYKRMATALWVKDCVDMATTATCCSTRWTGETSTRAPSPPRRPRAACTPPSTPPARSWTRAR